MREHSSDQEPGVLYPLRSVNALPVGLQVIGPLFGDLAVLRACHAYEEAAGVSWPSAELTTRLDEIATSAEITLDSKRWTKRREGTGGNFNG